MNINKSLNELLELLKEGPILPGGINKSFNVCGQKKCRCKDPENPQLHGPYSKLSFAVEKRNSVIAIKKGKEADAAVMVERFKSAKTLLNLLALDYVDLVKKCKFDSDDYPNIELSDKETFHQKTVVEKSRDNWKNKAIERQIQLREEQYKSRDYKKARDSWKQKSITQKERIDSLVTDIEAIKKDNLELLKKLAKS